MSWAFRLLGLVALVVATACATGPEAWEPISPLEFHFTSLITSESGAPGGWKVARLLISLVRKQGRTSRVVWCRVQVEVPEVNWQGVITDERAQFAAAAASDAAAQRVLGQNLLSAEMCRRYYEEMEKLLQQQIAGARVKDFADYPGSPPRRK
jgi:hypothetical protein